MSGIGILSMPGKFGVNIWLKPEKLCEAEEASYFLTPRIAGEFEAENTSTIHY